MFNHIGAKDMKRERKLETPRESKLSARVQQINELD